MQIRHYDEVDPYDVNSITTIAFDWTSGQRDVDYLVKNHSYVMDGYALYAVERRRAVAQVIPLKLPVVLKGGPTIVGGLQGVCSLPEVWGRGYVRRLIERAHEMYRE